MNNRETWLDYIKGICMVAIIANHIYGPAVIGVITYPFELVGFFFAAGYTFSTKRKGLRFLTHKVRTLVVPVIVFSFINTALTSLMNHELNIDRLLGIFIQMPGRWDDIWFVACLFSMEVLFSFIVKIKNCSLQLFVVLLLNLCAYLYHSNYSIRLPWHIENAFLFMPVIWLGYYMRTTGFVGHIKNFLNTKHYQAYIMICCLCILFMVSVLSYRNYPIDVHLLEFGNPWIFLVSSLLGLSTVILLSLLMEVLWNTIRPLQFIGMNTLVYYAFQSKIITMLCASVERLGICYSESVIITIAICLITCGLLCIPTYIVNNYCPWILGKTSAVKS